MKPRGFVLLLVVVTSALSVNVTVFRDPDHDLRFSSTNLSLDSFLRRLSPPDTCSVLAILDDTVAPPLQRRYRRILHYDGESSGVLEISGAGGNNASLDYSRARCSAESVVAFVDSGSLAGSASSLSQFRRKSVVLVVTAKDNDNDGVALEALEAFHDLGFVSLAVVAWGGADDDDGQPMGSRSMAAGVAQSLTLLVTGVSVPRTANLTSGFRVAAFNVAPIFWPTGRSQVFPRYTGYGAKICLYLAEALGVPLTIVMSPPGGVLPNGTAVGDVAAILAGGLDAGGLPRQLLTSWTDVVDAVYPVVKDDYCFAVPRARPLPPEKVLAATFHPTLGAALAAILAVFTAGLSASLTLHHRTSKESGVSSVVVDAAMTVLRALLTGTLDRGARWSSARVFAVSVVVLNIILASVVQSSIFSLYSSPHSPPDIDTVEDLLRYSETVLTVPYYGHFFRSLDDQDPTLHSVAVKLEDVDVGGIQEAIKRVALEQGAPASMLMTRNFFSGIQRVGAFRDAEGLQTLHVPQECLLSPIFLSVPVTRRLASYRLDTKLLRAQAMGFVAKWLADTWYELETLGVYLPLEPSRRTYVPRPLVLRHIDPALRALLCGALLAATVFLAELVTGKWMKPLSASKEQSLNPPSPVEEHVLKLKCLNSPSPVREQVVTGATTALTDW